MDFSRLLEGKSVLVTGASRGLGRCFASVMAERGANVAFSYSRDEEGAQITQKSINNAGKESLSYKVSVLDSDGMNQMVEDIEAKWGSVDVLINNAGISQSLPIALLEEADWDKVMDINIKGQYLAARAVLRGMIRRRKGHILNLSSIAGVKMLEAPIHYVASKAAAKGFTEALSKEVARYNIRVNCLAPGLLDDGVANHLPEHRRRDYLKHLALHRIGTLEEVAKCASFLVSDRNSYMNGFTVVIDGGF